jgi:hypothetical protein
MGAGQVLNSHRQAILEKICSTPRSVMVGNCLHACWSALRWQNDTEYNALVRTHLSWSADVSATIGCDDVVDLVVGNRRPYTVHLNFVVVANHTTLGRPTIHQIAARASAIVSFEFRVETLMPFIVARSVVSFLRRCAYTKKQRDRAAEQRDELAASHLIEGHSMPTVIGALALAVCRCRAKRAMDLASSLRGSCGCLPRPLLFCPAVRLPLSP